MILIVSAIQEGRWLAVQLLIQESGSPLVGFVNKKSPVTLPLFYDLVSLGTVEQSGEFVERFGVNEIILISSSLLARDFSMEIFRKIGMSDKVNIRISPAYKFSLLQV